ncbi:hypothetical protein AKJ16_DCAP02975 [Drosera capensis]
MGHCLVPSLSLLLYHALVLNCRCFRGYVGDDIVSELFIWLCSSVILDLLASTVLPLVWDGTAVAQFLALMFCKFFGTRRKSIGFASRSLAKLQYIGMYVVEVLRYSSHKFVCSAAYLLNLVFLLHGILVVLSRFLGLEKISNPFDRLVDRSMAAFLAKRCAWRLSYPILVVVVIIVANAFIARH